MLLGLVLFYVGAVLILNGLWMLERISDREIWVINLFVGVLSLLAALRQAFGADAVLGRPQRTNRRTQRHSSVLPSQRELRRAT